MKIRSYLALALFLAPLGPAFAAPEKVEFCAMESDLVRLAGSRANAETAIREYLKDKQILYVEGLLGSTRSAFVDNAAALHALDASLPITKLGPPGNRSVEENALHLIFDIHRVSLLNPGRKIILMGLSKGGAEILQTAVRDSRIFNDVEVIVPMNAAIGGSILADLEQVTDADLTKRWEEYRRANKLEKGYIADKLARLAKYYLLDTGSAGFRSMTTTDSKQRNEALRLKAKADSDLLNSKILYVTTSRAADAAGDIPSLLAGLAGFITAEGGANDGLLFEKDQILENVGTHLLSVSKASHFNLTGSTGKSECRQDFTRFLFYKLASGK